MMRSSINQTLKKIEEALDVLRVNPQADHPFFRQAISGAIQLLENRQVEFNQALAQLDKDN